MASVYHQKNVGDGKKIIRKNMEDINYDQEIEKQKHPENFDEDHGDWCDLCHVATGDCDCEDCPDCQEARE